MRKILIFSLAYYPKYVGGAEVSIKEITDRISPNEIKFDMVTLSGGNEHGFEKIGNINVHKIGNGVNIFSKLMYPFRAYKKALELHSKNSYSAIWSMMASYAGYAGYLFKKKNSNIPFILSIQEGENFQRRKGILNFLFKRIFKSADKIQVISTFLENWSREMGAIAPITIVPNAVDYKFFSTYKSPDEIRFLQEKLGKKSGDVFLITTSRLVKKNDVVSVIESLKFLPENVKFLILGVGYEEKMLKKKVKKLKLEERVKFLGYIPHSEMPLYLHVSDIFVRPALSEGFGNSYIEAMAAGLPVIATPVGGIIDFIKDGETGLFSQIKNPKSIAQKVEKLLKDKESCEYIVNNGRNLAREKYDWNIIANTMKNEVFLKTI
jgi:glycosyltransferase involved in cell wall biosynthesis